jgi:CBS domain containing-hemolysin-like protein
MIISAVSFVLIFILSAFFSGAEMAFVSADKVRLRKLADGGDSAAKTVMGFYEKPQRFLISILIGNNITQIFTTAILTYIFIQFWKLENQWLVTLIMAPLMIVFGEMVPKDYCRLKANMFLMKNTFWLKLFFAIFYYPAEFFLRSVNFFLPPTEAGARKSIFVNEEEFRSLIEESVRLGVVNRYQKKMIDTILDFERTSVSSVMIPLELVPKVDIAATVGEVKATARETHSRMVLVYEEDPSIVVGMIYVYDLLFENRDDLELKQFLRSPIFLPQGNSVENAFLTLQAKRQSYAVVMSADGDVIGAVPIERLLTYNPV